MEPSRIVVQASGVVVARVTPGGIIVHRFIPHRDNVSHGGVEEPEAVFALNQGVYWIRVLRWRCFGGGGDDV
jgi:hypothetical protein